MISFANSDKCWGLLSISLHWLSVILVISLIALGFWMVDLDYYHQWYKDAPDLHKNIGVSLFILTILRLLWLKISSRPKPLDSHTNIEKKLAHAVHIAIYLLLFCIMSSGYFISTADKKPLSYWSLLEIPALTSSIENQEDIAGEIHFYLVCCFCFMLFLHICGALKHHFIDRDQTLLRMFGRANYQ